MAEIPVYVCSHIFENTRPILLVCKENEEWQFLCGGEHEREEIPRVVGLNHMLERDNTLSEIMGLENDSEAERQEVGGTWLISKL